MPTNDFEGRRPVWQALSNLFLDTELQEVDFNYIARILAESKYSDAEIHAILFGEVYPVCIPNMHHPTGVWTCFNLIWLEQQISQKNTIPHDQFQNVPSDYWMIEKEWCAVLERLPQARDKLKS